MVTNKTKLPLPEHVMALGIPFQVQVVDQVDAEESAGETVAEHRIIKIAANQDTRRRWTTLLHEYLHATLAVNGVGSVIDEQVEEIIVQSIEHAIESFLLDHGADFIRALEVRK